MSTDRPEVPVNAAEVVEQRKAEHLRQGLADVEAQGAPRWDDVRLVHRALPELDFDDIQLSTTLLGRRLGAPIMIASLTGGHPMAEQLNARLARAAELRNIPMGVGSQRAALVNPSLARTYSVTRREAPNAYLAANIGAAQLIQQASAPALTRTQIEAAIEMIAADALIVHLNFLEEIVQPEGDRQARGCLEAIARLVAHLDGRVPVIVKETGAGLSPTVATMLLEAGVAALDVGGQGGTSFAAVEARRAASRGDAARARLGATFRDWGVPAAVSVYTVAALGAPVIASGGVRTGLDAARAIALGATAVGLARPMLEAATLGDDELLEFIDIVLLELRSAMLLTGHETVESLRRSAPIIMGETAEWLRHPDVNARDRGEEATNS